jgi:hypothetical protein
MPQAIAGYGVVDRPDLPDQFAEMWLDHPKDFWFYACAAQLGPLSS